MEWLFQDRFSRWDAMGIALSVSLFGQIGVWSALLLIAWVVLGGLLNPQ